MLASRMEPTPRDRIERYLDRLTEKKDEWTKVPIPKRIEYLERALAGVAAQAEKWVEGGCLVKGLAATEPAAGEEWLAGPVATARAIRLYIEALRQGGAPKTKVKTRPDGQQVARVFPLTFMEQVMLPMRAEVWIEPGKPATQGRIYREGPGPGKVALVLGAGNVSSIPPLDALYKLFVENEVVLLKMNPVNEHVGPRLEEALKALVDDGYLAIVYGGADVGAFCASHPKVDTLHVTGSDKTYDAVVWGADPAERARRKAANDPVSTKPFTAELGCVTPVIVVPGPWWEKEMEWQARSVAGMVAQNASFNCNAAKVLVTSRDWLQRDAFLGKLRDALARTPPRKAYYPGAEDRWRKFLDAYPEAEVVGPRAEGAVPWTILPDVPPRAGEYALTEEAWCGILAETSLDARGPEDFLEKAVDFANDVCWGTLSCILLVHPATMRDFPEAVDRAIARLRYGGVAVNCWAGALFALGSTSWGAFPGHTPQDIRSGTGVVHNAMLFDHPQKSVVVAPFTFGPKPAWFADHRSLAEVGRRMLDLETGPTWGRLLRVARAALRG
jgi:acyl-CoA reductase-like NAD-dependent aldehyde dehydrogenase